MLELHDIHNYFDTLTVRGKYRPVIGNDKVRLLISLLFPLRRTSIILNGEAGSGKSTIIKGAAQLTWGTKVLDDEVPQVIIIGGTSEKGLLSEDMADRITNEATHCIIPELEFIASSDRNYDVVKVWTEGEVYPYTKAANFGKSTDRIVLRPLPILTSLANENKRMPVKDLGEEMERRFLPLYTESNREMNVKIHNRKAEIEALPRNKINLHGEKEKELSEHMLRGSMLFYGNGELMPIIRNPSAPFMAKAIPKRFTVSNTFVDYWHEIVKAVTTFYSVPRENENGVLWNEMSRKVYGAKSTEKYIMATPADNYLAWLLGGESIVFASLRLKDLGKVLMSVVPNNKDGYDAKSIDDIVDDMAQMGYERSKNQIKDLLMQLEWATYIKSDGERNYWKTKEYSDEFQYAIDWKGCIEFTKKWVKEEYPEISSDYIHEFCEDPKCKDPFTGNTINILDLETVVTEKPKKEEDKKTRRVTLEDLE